MNTVADEGLIRDDCMDGRHYVSPSKTCIKVPASKRSFCALIDQIQCGVAPECGGQACSSAPGGAREVIVVKLGSVILPPFDGEAYATEAVKSFSALPQFLTSRPPL